MQDRFRVDGVDLGVDVRASVVHLGADGELSCRIVADRPLPGSADQPPPRIELDRVVVRLDADGFGADLDGGAAGDPLVEVLVGDHAGAENAGLDEWFDPGGGDLDGDDLLAAPGPEAVLRAGGRYDLVGRVTVLAGERVRVRAEARLGGAADAMRVGAASGAGFDHGGATFLRLDVSVGSTRRTAV